MLIRFFKEIDLIGCGGDTQPIRLQVGTFSQSDYRCAHRGCMQGLRVQGWWGHSANQITQGLHTRVAHARVEGTLSQSDYTGVVHRGCAQGLHARVVCAGVVCKGGGDTQPIRLHRGCAQGLCAVGPSLFVLGNHWLPLATIDLVGDNREFEV